MAFDGGEVKNCEAACSVSEPKLALRPKSCKKHRINMRCNHFQRILWPSKTKGFGIRASIIGFGLPSEEAKTKVGLAHDHGRSHELQGDGDVCSSAWREGECYTVLGHTCMMCLYFTLWRACPYFRLWLVGRWNVRYWLILFSQI